MPARWFVCPDNTQIEISKCLENKGCPFPERCSSIPFLRLIGYDREFRGITPSMAGNGPRLIWLKATTDYPVNPQSRVWAAVGIGTHGKLSLHRYTYNVLSEESLSDEDMKGIPDVLEKDEASDHGYSLIDYKVWGSYKVAQALGLKRVSVEILDKEGKPSQYKGGEKKGKNRTRKETVCDATSVDLMAEELQLNSYRRFFEKAGFPINSIRIMAIPRDGGTYIAEGRGVTKNIYMIPIKRLPDKVVENYYAVLRMEVEEAFKTGKSRKCSQYESWQRRRCVEQFCEVFKECQQRGE